MLDERILVALVMLSALLRLFGPWIRLLLRHSAQRSRARTLLVMLRLRQELTRRDGSTGARGGASSKQGDQG